MKYSRIFRILAMATILSLLVIALPTSQVFAAEVIELDPDDGEIDDTIDIAGEDFEESYYNSPTDYHDSYVDIYFSSEEADEGDEIGDEVENYERVKSSVYVDEDGEFDSYFYVPDELTDGDEDEDVHGGTYYVYVTYFDDDEIVDVVTFTVLAAEIELDPNEGSVGTEIEITGIDFFDNEDITVEYDDDEIDIDGGDDETDSDGEFTCTVIIPESTTGEHTITVTDDSGIVAEADFTVEPDITSPESGSAGQTVTVIGTGFGEEVDYVVYFDNYEVFDDETDEYGSFVSKFIVPALGAGTYDVEILDDDDNSAEAVFSIDEFIVIISPTNGHAGTEVTVSGTGFIPNKSVSIAFDNDFIANKSIDSSGNLNASFIVPSLAAGNYLVRVSDGTNTEEVIFAIDTTASISSTSGYVGAELTLSGAGFAIGRTITVSYDSEQVATIGVNPDATFSVAFSIPASVNGAHTIIATDGTNTEQLNFSMESTPPSTLYPQLPIIDSKLEDWRFDWCGDAADLSKEVTDESLPVTYALQIATSDTFSEDSIELEITGLTESEYTLAAEERLESVSKDTPYYWRVKATDAALNETDWTETGTFYVGFSWRLSQQVIYVLIGIGALLLGSGLGFWLGRKNSDVPPK
ncbi:IPT/TIG domain-containing protein [Chloroflexota bacterium]